MLSLFSRNCGRGETGQGLTSKVSRARRYRTGENEAGSSNLFSRRTGRTPGLGRPSAAMAPALPGYCQSSRAYQNPVNLRNNDAAVNYLTNANGTIAYVKYSCPAASKEVTDGDGARAA